MAKVLLIQPGDEPNRERGIDDAALPIGLISIGSYLETYKHKVKILDRNINPSNEYLNQLLKEDYDFVGIGTYTGRMLYDAIDVSKRVKENSNSIVIWGGFHPTIVPKQTLDNSYVDYIIRGEGEETFLEVLNRFEKKKDFSKLNGVNLNPDAVPPDLNKFPILNYSLLDIKKYPNFYVSTSRGCPYKCTFCYNSYGEKSIKPYRNLDVDKSINLIKEVVKKYKRKTFTIVDDNFPSDKERMKIICNEIKKMGIKFDTFCRANYCDLETLTLLKEAGCWQIQIGIESGSQRILNLLHKGTTVKMNSEAIKNCRKVGIMSHCSFMIGLPTETIDDLKMTLDFIKTNKPDLGGVGIFHPYPRTKLWDSYKEESIQEPKTTEEWAEKYPTNFRGTKMNISKISNEDLIYYYDYINKLINKGRYIKKIWLYLKNGRLPSYKRVIGVFKRK